ncbi:MAG: helix-turn-helix transcriptional regulator [Planctomycetes bacterium]|nr:helix-turn-helix transcriptional regulator [Planctomycetota bacterium]
MIGGVEAALVELRAALAGVEVDPARLAGWIGTSEGVNMGAGERVEELRKEWGLSQREFAKLLGVSNAAVSRWEAGESGAAERRGGAPLLDALLLLIESAPVKARRLLEQAQRERDEG